MERNILIRFGRLPAVIVLGVCLALLPAIAAESGEAVAKAVVEEAAEAQQEQEQEQEQTKKEDEPERAGFEEVVTVTGTRFKGRTVTDTPAPVDVINEAAIRSTGATETGKILQLLAPSFNFSSTTISDGTDIIRPATLRALGPDQVLVLVNGKRRHQQALMNVQQTIARGSAGYDINAIPASAIARIEVLRDGAAAQYGSDAIAGVINIILKNDVDATTLAFDVGQHYAGDGEVFSLGVNSGFRIADNGYFNVSFEYRDRGETNRAGLATTNLLGWYDQTDFDNGVRERKLRIGDADSQNIALFFNADIPAGNGEFYTFGGYSNREGNSSGFYRGPSDGRTIPDIYPNGFLPTIITEPTDFSVAAGYRGIFPGDWTYDFAVNYGNSEFKFREENTANVSYWYEPLDPNDPTGPRFEESPTSADTGTLEFDQITFNADFTGVVGELAGGPVNLALGAEWRQDGYKIVAGDEVSYEYGRTNDRNIQIFDQTGSIAQPGTQGFPGWSPQEAVDEDRDSVGVYADVELPFTDRFLGGAAVRFEDYSDFGSTVTGKLSGRFELTDEAAVRATVSTGFRAPGVQQTFYSQRSTNLNNAGVLTDTLTARQGGPVTQAFGVPALKEETSVNFSVGLVAVPARNFRFTVDLYRIEIDDRIVFSSNIQPEDPAGCGSPPDPSVCPILAILEPFGVGQVLFFTNAIDTETNGLDIVSVYDIDLSPKSVLSFEGAFHFNDTEVSERRSTSSILPADVLFDDTQITLIEEGQPGEHFVMGATYRRADWAANVRFNYFGEVSGQGFTGVRQTWGGKVLTDVSLTFPVIENGSVTVGGTNIFDQRPDHWDESAAFPFPQLGFTYGWETLPFGINGGYYFARFNYRFDHK